jgi:hypothetical protein
MYVLGVSVMPLYLRLFDYNLEQYFTVLLVFLKFITVQHKC